MCMQLTFVRGGLDCHVFVLLTVRRARVASECRGCSYCEQVPRMLPPADASCSRGPPFSFCRQSPAGRLLRRPCRSRALARSFRREPQCSSWSACLPPRCCQLETPRARRQSEGARRLICWCSPTQQQELLKKSKENKEKNDKERFNYDKQYSSYFAVRRRGMTVWAVLRVVSAATDQGTSNSSADSVPSCRDSPIGRSRRAPAAGCPRTRPPATGWATPGAVSSVPLRPLSVVLVAACLRQERSD